MNESQEIKLLVLCYGRK